MKKVEEVSRTLFVGAKVTLDPKSRFWWENYPKNPRGIIGKVIRIAKHSDDESKVWWRVEWSNGNANGYQNGDLKVIGKVVAHE